MHYERSILTKIGAVIQWAGCFQFQLPPALPPNWSSQGGIRWHSHRSLEAKFAGNQYISALGDTGQNGLVMFGRHRRSDVIARVLTRLLDQNLVKCVIDVTGGRPAERYQAVRS